MTEEVKNDKFLQSHWRPLLAVTYMIILLFDFVLAPMLWTSFQAFVGADTLLPWAPLSLTSNGLLHVTVGSVLGISAYTRGQEKITRVEATKGQ